MDLTKTFTPNFLLNKTALITGGHRGMLYIMAQELMRFGAKVAIMSRNEENIKQAVDKLNAFSNSTNCIGLKCDVRNYKDVEKAVDIVASKFERIDIVINGAAGNFLAPFDKLSSNGFRTVFEIDTLGTFNVSKAVYERSMKKTGGNIVNISTTLHYNSSAMVTHAVAAKAAVDAITRNLAMELVIFIRIFQKIRKFFLF
jgi:peroxisomal 2,4-dienoyl-CoA reductase